MVWDIDPTLLKLGPLEVRYYGLCFVAALLGGFYFWRAQMRRGGYSDERAERLFMPCVIGVIVGARLGHVLFYEPGRFAADPLSILYVWKGGLASHGATVGIILALLWYARREKMAFWEVGDRLSFSIAWAAGLVRLGNFMNSEIVGRTTDVAWAVKFPRHDWSLSMAMVPPRHPSQLYEFAMAMVILGALALADRLLGGEKRPRGALALLFLALYFTARFLVEFVKEYQALLPGASALTMGQYLSIPFALAGFTGLAVVVTRAKGK